MPVDAMARVRAARASGARRTRATRTRARRFGTTMPRWRAMDRRAMDAMDARWTRATGEGKGEGREASEEARATARADMAVVLESGRSRGTGAGEERRAGRRANRFEEEERASRSEEEGARMTSTSGSGPGLARGDGGAFALIGTPGRCVTTFRVRKRTRFGQRVVLVGSTAELGTWRVLGGSIRCAPEGNDWWSATVCLEVPTSRVVGEECVVCEYNFAVIDDVAESTGPTYVWRSGTSALTLPSYAFMVEVVDVWTEEKREFTSLTDTFRMNEPALKQVLQYYTGGASKSLRARDDRNVKTEIWFPSDDCAVLTEDGEAVEILENVRDEEEGDQAMRVGDVYLGTVVSKVPNMKSLLVGVATKNGKFTKTVLLRDGLSQPAAWWKGQESDKVVIEASEVSLPDEDEDVEMKLISSMMHSDMNDQLARAGKQAFGMYNIGDAVILEIIRDSREHKGAIATAEPSLTGRFTVFKGTANGVSAHASKKLSVVTRDSLAQWGENTLKQTWRYGLEKIRDKNEAPLFTGFHGGGAHLIMRSASASAPPDVVTREVSELTRRWKSMCISAAKSVTKSRKRQQPLVPRLLWRDNTNFKGMVLRELASTNIHSIVMPNDSKPEELEEITKSVSTLRADTEEMQTVVRVGSQVKMQNLIRRARTFSERVTIPDTQSAQLVIQSTEALTAIDVNTGSSRMSVAEINVMAARTAAAEIRRRNISGIIVIDFVNAGNPKTRDQIYRQIEAEFADAATRDRGKISFMPISAFGLMQITRSHIPYGPKVEAKDVRREDARSSTKSSATKWLDKRKTR